MYSLKPSLKKYTRAIGCLEAISKDTILIQLLHLPFGRQHTAPCTLQSVHYALHLSLNLNMYTSCL